MGAVPVPVPGWLLTERGLPVPGYPANPSLGFFDLAEMNNCCRIKFIIWNMNTHPESIDPSFLAATG